MVLERCARDRCIDVLPLSWCSKGVHEIDQEDRDKIVFLTAGIAVLSLLVNGTTTGPLVRFLKLDR